MPGEGFIPDMVKTFTSKEDRMTEAIVKVLLGAIALVGTLLASALVLVGTFLIGALISTIPFYFAWNWALVDAIPIAQLPKLTLFQAFGVLVVFRALLHVEVNSFEGKLS